MSRGIGGYIGRGLVPGFSEAQGIFGLRDYYDQVLSKRGSIKISASGLDTVVDLNQSSGYTITTPGFYTVEAAAGTAIGLELWGAGGGGDATGSFAGGAGGYASGIFTFSGTKICILVGEGGIRRVTPATSAYPDGGLSQDYGSNGGGSTRVGANTINPADPNNASSLYYLIAGGGGGSHYSGGKGGGGGGTNGQAGSGSSYSAGVGGGGTQSAGGAGGAASNYGGTGSPGTFLKGGDGNVSSSYGRGGSGGGGYYGGGAGGTVYAPGGGGSGYINTTYITNGSLAAASYETPPNPNGTRVTGYGGPNQGGLVIITKG